MNDLAVSMSGVQKSYGEFTLDLGRLDLERGYVLGLVGPNGAGKSTTIRIMLNLVYPDRGRVTVLGRSQPSEEMEIKRRVGYVSESPSFYDEMTVDWMARFVGRYYPTWNRGLFEAYARKFALDPGKRVKALSRGMKMKLALALALSHRPGLLILDEPTSGLDPVVRRELLEEIADLIRDERRSVVFSTHITHDVDRIADYVAILDGGRVVEHGSREDVADRWRKVSGTLARPDAQAAGIGSLLTGVRVSGAAFTATTGAWSGDLSARLHSAGARNVKTVEMSLDEILLSLAGKGV